MKLSLSAHRAQLLAAQGLHEPPVRAAGAADVLAIIRRMGLLQLDSISVIARSHYLVLWSRLGAYDLAWLDALLPAGALFEYWAHAMCLLPIEDYAIYRQRMCGYAEGGAYRSRAAPEVQVAIDRVLAHLEEHGPARVGAMGEARAKAGTWWAWTPTRQALEYLFNAGEVMVARRDGFQRVYDLRERVLPGWDDAATLGHAEGTRALVLKAVKALGVAPARWIALYVPDYLRSRTAKRELPHILAGLADEELLLPVAVDGWREPAYIHRDHVALAEQAAAGGLQSSVTTLLSPFDPVVSDRARAEELFGFRYRIEVYTPAARRQYGYFTLPLLHRGALVGRVDAKAHRKAGMFEVKALHLEPATPPSNALAVAVAATLRTFADWHGTPAITLGRSDLPQLAAVLGDV